MKKEHKQEDWVYQCMSCMHCSQCQTYPLHKKAEQFIKDSEVK